MRNAFPRVRIQKWRSLITLATQISKMTLKIISSLTTLTAMTIKITWKIVLHWLRCLRWYIDYADYADIQICVKNNFIIDYTHYTLLGKATIGNTFIDDYVDIQEQVKISHQWLCWLPSSTYNNCIDRYFV